MTKRAHIGLKTKLCATLCQLMRYVGDGEWERIISYDEAKTLTEDQILARFHFDHGIAHAHDGSNAPWNLTPMPVEEHRKKTATIDIPRIAKGKRINKSNAAFENRLLAKDRGEPRTPSRWPKRKMQSRPFERRA